MRPLRDSLREALRPVQRSVFPIRNMLRMRAWQAARSAPVIVNYHGVVQEIADPFMQTYSLTAAQFRRSLQIILEHHEVVRLDRLVEALERSGPLSPRWAVLTFDDGYVNTLTIARPILRELGDLPATVFVCPGCAEHEGAWLPDALLRLAILYCPARVLELGSIGVRLELGSPRQRLRAYRDLMMTMLNVQHPLRSEVAQEALSALKPQAREELRVRFHSEELVGWKQLEELAREPGIDIGGHSMRHVMLHKDQPCEIVEREVGECRAVLEQRLGRGIRHFAYPGGMHSPQTRDLVMRAGYGSALTIRPGEVTPGCDRFLLPRLSSSPYPAVMRRMLACAAFQGTRGWWF